MPDDTHSNCPFCIKNGKVNVMAENALAYLIAVLRPNGEIMANRYFVIPKTHVTTYSDLLRIPEWNEAFLDMLAAIPGGLMDFNISVNQGFAAGMRVTHVHIWVILRGEEKTPSYGMGMAALIDEKDSGSS